MFDLEKHIERQKVFSLENFGPGNAEEKVDGIVDHIRKELIEVLENPMDTYEWIDIVLLALDGAARTGSSAKDICFVLGFKQTINEERDWPDYRNAEPGKAIEHI